MEIINDFQAWAWLRHLNLLSWYIRPLFLIPFVYFAYRRSWPGIIVTLIALATSMFWFPAPANPDPRAFEFLAAEREYLTWTMSLHSHSNPPLKSNFRWITFYEPCNMMVTEIGNKNQCQEYST